MSHFRLAALVLPALAASAACSIGGEILDDGRPCESNSECAANLACLDVGEGGKACMPIPEIAFPPPFTVTVTLEPPETQCVLFHADAGDYRFTTSNADLVTCPGDTQLDLFIAGQDAALISDDDGGIFPCSSITASLPQGDFDLCVFANPDGGVLPDVVISGGFSE